MMTAMTMVNTAAAIRHMIAVIMVIAAAAKPNKGGEHLSFMVAAAVNKALIYIIITRTRSN